MGAFGEVIQPFCFWVARASWQASVLIVLVLLVQWWLRSLTPYARYSLWFLVLLRLALPVSIESRFSLFNHPWLRPPAAIAVQEDFEKVTFRVSELPHVPNVPEEMVVAGATWVTSPAEESNQDLALRAFVLVWLAGALLVFGRVCWVSFRLSARMRRAAPVTDLAVLRLIEECRNAASVRQPLYLIETPEVRSPALFSLAVPKLLLPDGMIGRFTLEELRFILLHELCHVRRRDIALNWLVAVLQALHWFNPLAWFMFSRLRSDRELACDAKVLGRLKPDETRGYGATIIRLLDGSGRAADRPALVGILEGAGRLKLRLALIAGFRHEAPHRRWPAFAVALVLGLAALTDANSRPPGGLLPGVVDLAPRMVAIRVVDGETGRGIPGARLGTGHLTDGEGNCRIEIASRESIRVRADGYVPRSAKPDTAVVRLERGFTIGGVVRDPEGRPIPAVQVQLSCLLAGPTPENLLVETDGQGRWRSTELARRSGGVAIRLCHPDYQPVLYVAGSAHVSSNLATLSLDDLAAEQAELKMERGVEVRGRVLEPSGRAIEGAAVSQMLSYGCASCAVTRTDSSGGFYLRTGIGSSRLHAEARGFMPALEPVWVLPKMNPIRIHLKRARTLRGRVVDEQGKPVAGSVVSTHGRFTWSQRTGPDGSFAWESAPPHPVEIRISAEGYAWTQRPLWLEAGKRQYEIRLHTLGTVRVHGTVLDVETAAPVPKFSVLLNTSRLFGAWQNYRRIAIAKDGNFSLVLREPFTACRLRIEAGGYLPKDLDTVAAAGGEISIEARLSRGFGPSGIVRLADGRPAPGATVLITGGRFLPFMNEPGQIRGSAGNSRPVFADSTGRFSCPAIADARAIVVAHADGFASVPVERLAADQVVVLEPWGRVQGKLQRGRSPGRRETVMLAGSSADGSARVLAIQLSVRTDGEGRFLFDRVPAGRYTLAPAPALEGLNGPRFSQITSVTVGAGQTTTVQLGGRGRTVVGRVVFVGRKETIDWNRLNHVLETVESPSAILSFAVQFSPGGSYRIEDVPPGTYRLKLQIPGASQPFTRDIVIAEMPGGRSDVPVNLGNLTIR